MSTLSLSAGDSLVLWVPERGCLAQGAPLSDLRQALNDVGFACDTRLDPSLPSDSAFLALGLPPASSEKASKPPVADGFELDWSAAGVRLVGGGPRGLSFAVWEFLERLGWAWPTPQIEREPEAREWTFPIRIEKHAPALKHRVFFAEQVEITPALIRWLSRLRLNTLFPSNPARFEDPESQFPPESLAMAETLGFDLIAGGDSARWLLGPLGDESLTWDTLPKRKTKRALEAILELWREMGEPSPRLSIWAEESEIEPVARILAGALEAVPELLVETGVNVSIPEACAGRTLFHLSDRGLSPLAEREDDEARLLEGLKGISGREVYLLLDPLGWDVSLGNPISPALWRVLVRRIALAGQVGCAGAGLSLARVDARSFLERAGFAYSLAARAMWSGEAEVSEPEARRILEAQFDSGAEAAATLLADLERWLRRDCPRGVSGFAEAHSALLSEGVRDKLDQRISEILESAPNEACMELARSLSTLVGLYDLEECPDVHESRALARTLWSGARIDSWPAWLQAKSPLAERLRGHL